MKSPNQPLENWNQINQKLKDYMQFRQTHSIENLIQTTKKESRPISSTFQQRSTPKKLSVLFQKFQKEHAHTDAQSQLMRQTNKQIDSPIFKNRLRHGLSKQQKLNLGSSFKTEDYSNKKETKVSTQGDCEMVEHVMFNQSTISKANQSPQTPQKSNTKFKSFTQLSHVFTPYGPARSQNSMQIRLIVSGNFKEKPSSNKYSNVNTKNIVKVQNFLLQRNKSQGCALMTQNQKTHVPSQRNRLVQKIWGEQDQVPSPKTSFYVSRTSNACQKVSDFVKLVKSINTMEMTMDRSARSSPIMNNRYASSAQNFFKSSKKSHLKEEKVVEIIHDKKANNLERGNLYDFINNKWLDFIVHSRSIVRNDDFTKYLEKYNSNKVQVDVDQNKISQHSEIRRQFKSISSSPKIKDNIYVQDPNSDMKAYLNKKIRKYVDVSQEGHQTKITKLDDEIWKLRKHRDEEDLLEFDNTYYGYPVKKRRVVRKMWYLIRTAIQLKTNIHDMISKKMVNSRAFELKGSFAFFEDVKQGETQRVSQALNQFPGYIFEFDELHQTALFISIKKNNLKMTSLLIQHGADVNICNVFNQRPLLYAIVNDNLDMMKLLLSSGANPWDYLCRDYYRYCRSVEVKSLLKISQYMDIQRRCNGVI